MSAATSTFPGRGLGIASALAAAPGTGGPGEIPGAPM